MATPHPKIVNDRALRLARLIPHTVHRSRSGLSNPAAPGNGTMNRADLAIFTALALTFTGCRTSGHAPGAAIHPQEVA